MDREHVEFALVDRPVFDGPSELDRKTACDRIEIHREASVKKETYPPSMLERKAICPGYKRDDTGDETYAEQGRLCHKAVETEDLTPIPDELKASVEKCISYKHALIAALPEAEILQEVDLPYLDQRGRADLIVVDRNNKRAICVDYKFAQNFYPADSPQFHAYCVAIWDMYPVDKILVKVVHPFFAENEVDECEFMRTTHYNKFYAEIAAIITRGRKNDPADYRISAQCGFCGFAGQCPTLAALGIEVAQRYATELELPEGSLHGSDVTDPEKMKMLLDIKPVVLQAAGGWSKAGLEMAQNGVDIPGYEIHHRNGRRAITSAKAVWKLIKEKFIPGIEPEDFLEHATITATGLDALVSAATPTGRKSKEVQRLACELEDNDLLTSGAGSDYLGKSRKQ